MRAKMFKWSVSWARNRSKAFARFWLMIGLWWLLLKVASTAILWALVKYNLISPGEAASWKESLKDTLVLAAAGLAVSSLLGDSAEEITARGVELDHQLKATADAIMKKLQSLQRELPAQIEEAVAQAMSDGLQRGRENQSVAEREKEEMRWLEMSDTWATTKAQLDDLVAKARREISDGRSRRRYKELSGHHYDDIAITLFGDDRLSSNATDAVIEMQAIFNAKKNRRQKVTPEDLDAFVKQRRIFKSST